jgi:hypothetical protein
MLKDVIKKIYKLKNKKKNQEKKHYFNKYYL